jgi:hypothetical protein
MKNLILLFLVIGAVVSSTALSNATGEVWAITYTAPTSPDYYSFTLTYDGQDTADGNYISLNTQVIGVACIPTSSTFALAAGQNNNAFSFSVAANATAATNTAATNWADLKMMEHSTVGFAGTTLTMGAAATTLECPITVARPTFANYVVTWTFTVATGCGPAPQIGSSFFAVCYAIPDNTVLFSADNAALANTVGFSVTYTAPTTTCATTGASTFATGATILAGIAYLQF